MLKPQNSVKSRHNKIQYWFWNNDIIKNEKYLKDLDNIHDNSDFDTVVMTSRFGFDFWNKSHKMHFARCVDHAHKLGIKVLLQLWPRGYFNPAQVDLIEAAALVSESEGIVYEGKLTLNFRTGNKRWPEIAPGIKSELLGAYAFVHMIFWQTADLRPMHRQMLLRAELSAEPIRTSRWCSAAKTALR